MIRRLLLGLVAAMLIVLGLVLLTGAGALWAAVGWSGSVVQSLGTVSSPAGAPALLMDVESVTAAGNWPVPGTPALAATSAAGDVLVRAGSAAVADEHLAAVPYGVATRTGDGWQVRSVPGPQQAGPVPTDGWRATATGSPAVLALQPPETVVLQNADGSAPVQVALDLRWQVDDAQRTIVALAAVGGVLAVGGTVVAFLAVRRGRAAA